MQKRIVIICLTLKILGSESIAHNVLALGEEADFEALNGLPALNPDSRYTKIHLSTEPVFLPNACYALCIFYFLSCCPTREKPSAQKQLSNEKLFVGD